MTASWSAESENTQRPPNWVEQDGQLYCLSCRVRRRGGASTLSPRMPAARTVARPAPRLRIQFEIERDPTREDNRIARARHTSIKSPSARRGRG